MAELAYRTIIGLEVHVQLLTRTKLFCGCSTEFGLPPNSATCPVCIGMPGVLPVMNRQAFQLALKAALALNCQIASFTKWDRKNYYYPDLPKNYQITQYDLPFSHDGYQEIEIAAGPKRIGIIRVHLEEDAGKMLHDEQGSGRESLVDLNRAGTPLLEIVSQPELSSPEEAKAYLEEIRLLLRELGISDCEMQEGSLRCDANVNIHIPEAQDVLTATPITEIKNLNSFRSVERAIRYEAKRQYDWWLTALDELQRKQYAQYLDHVVMKAKSIDEVLDSALTNASIPAHIRRDKATAGWDENRGITVVQRRKEEASDYRYFPEPDLVPVEVDAAWLERARASLGNPMRLPAALRQSLQKDYGLSAYDAGVATLQGRAFVYYAEGVIKASGDAKAAINLMTNEVLQTLNEQKIGIEEFAKRLKHENLAELIEIEKTGLNKQRAREVYAEMLANRVSAKEAMDKLGIKVVVDESQLREIVQRAVAANPKAVADFKKGKTKAADAIKGAVMRETKGMAKTEIVQQLLMSELQKE